MSKFGEKLRWFRSNKGESQEKLAKAVGKSREAYAKYELGENEPDLSTLTKLARHFGVPVDSIVTDDECIVINCYSEIRQYEAYLQDKDFVPYLELAVKIKQYGIDVGDVGNYVESIAKYIEKGGKGKKKHP